MPQLIVKMILFLTSWAKPVYTLSRWTRPLKDAHSHSPPVKSANRRFLTETFVVYGQEQLFCDIPLHPIAAQFPPLDACEIAYSEKRHQSMVRRIPCEMNRELLWRISHLQSLLIALPRSRS
jgi:hypothetical protein